MNTTVLRTSFKGYNKSDVLMRIDSLNAVVMMIEAGQISAAEASAKADEVMLTPIKTALSGFNKEDTDKYLSELKGKIING